MNKSLKRDIQLLTKILDNQNKIIKVLKRFGCNQKNLENDIEAFDLLVTKKFRNMIDHVYEDVNRAYLKAFIFSTISQSQSYDVCERNGGKRMTDAAILSKGMDCLMNIFLGRPLAC